MLDAADLFFFVDHAPYRLVAGDGPLYDYVAGSFAGEAAYFHVLADGLSCARHKKPNSSLLSRDSLELAQRMLRDPIRAMSGEPWTRQSGQDLRRFLVRTLERHTERRLNSAAALSRLGG